MNKYYIDAVTVTNKEEKRVHQLDAAQNKKYWMRYHRNMRAARGETRFYTKNGGILLHLF